MIVMPTKKENFWECESRLLNHRHLFHTWVILTNKTRYLTRDRTPLASMAYTEEV